SRGRPRCARAPPTAPATPSRWSRSGTLAGMATTPCSGWMSSSPSEPLRAAQALWDGAAAGFDEAADHGLRDPAVRAAWRALLANLLPPAPAAVLDMGCGTGS